MHEVKLPGLVAGGFGLKSHVGWGLTSNRVPPAPSYKRLNCLGLDPGELLSLGSVRRVSWPSMHEVKLLGLVARARCHSPGTQCHLYHRMKIWRHRYVRSPHKLETHKGAGYPPPPGPR